MAELCDQGLFLEVLLPSIHDVDPTGKLSESLTIRYCNLTSLHHLMKRVGLLPDPRKLDPYISAVMLIAAKFETTLVQTELGALDALSPGKRFLADQLSHSSALAVTNFCLALPALTSFWPGRRWHLPLKLSLLAGLLLL